MKRRDFLKGMGALFGGAAEACSAEPTAQPEREPQPVNPSITTPEKDTDTTEPAPDTDVSAEVIEEEIELFIPRSSAALEARISDRMQELREDFGAEIIFDRALDMEYEEEPLMDIVYDTLKERIQELPAFAHMDYRSINWMVELCCYGEVTAESAWDVDAIGGGSDKGLWQITDAASAQIAIERGEIDGTALIVDRFDPIDATNGAAEYFNFTLRALTPWIDKEPGEESTNSADSEELNIFDLANETEFIIPLIVTGYKCGPEPLKTALSNFYRSNPDTSLVGLDVFSSFIDHIKDNPVDGISDSTLDYFIKCLSLKRIFDAYGGEDT